MVQTPATDPIGARVNKNRVVAVGTITADAGQTSTAVFNLAMAAINHVFLTPYSATAAAEIAAGTVYVSARSKREFTVTYANDVTTDRTWGYIIVAGDFE